MQWKRIIPFIGLVALLLLLVSLVFCSILPSCRLGISDESRPFSGISSPVGRDDSRDIRTFASEDEFRRYLAEGESAFGYGIVRSPGFFEKASLATDLVTSSGATVANDGSVRVSETNVRTEGVDEPDIVKTDGSHLYFSRETGRFGRGIPAPNVVTDEVPISASVGTDPEVGMALPMPFGESSAETDIFLIEDPSAVSMIGSVPEAGETLLFDDTLVVFETSGRSVSGYDISDRRNPKRAWRMDIADGSGILEARKSGDFLYLVERTTVAGKEHPCPVRPLSTGLEIACTDIYRPGTDVGADSVFTVLRVDPSDGSVGDSVSFVGSYGESVVYMGTESIFLTFVEPIDQVGFFLEFVRENGSLFPSDLAERLERLSGYDIGFEAKSVELSRLVRNVFLGKDQDESLRLRTEIGNRMADYRQRTIREQESTGIVKIAIDGLRVVGSGSVPGVLLDDFSLDEYDGSLRVATTVGGRSSFFADIPTGSVRSENDVRILDERLRETGSVTGLGADERIYSARFIADRGYLVTFRETDPFYVLDLSDPERPRMTGELDIPGYSSYLHPLGEGLVLGIGKEGTSVKLSLFDVSDPSDPKESSKYLLDEYWSEAVSDRRAFLSDTERKVFFLPGNKGGYVFSYDGGNLSLALAVSGSRIRRATYVGDTLHIVGEESIVSYDERTWKKIGETDVSR